MPVERRPGLPVGGGEMGARIRAHDWAATPLGPVESWPQGLRTAVRLMLTTRHPAALFWGPELRCLYNDAYVPLLGRDRHPSSLGLPGRQVWAEAWPVVGPQIEGVLAGGEPTWDEDRHIPVLRNRRRTDAWWTYSCSPVDDETAPSGVGGILALCTETTSAVLARRRAEQHSRDIAAETERQRRLYEAILTNTPDLAYVFDRDHRFIYANEVLLRMWGRSREEAIGKTCLELGYEPWHAAMHDREIEQVIATRQPIRGEVPFAGAFGRRIYDYIFVPVLGADGGVEAVAGTTRDVTERKAAEAALREGEARLQVAVDAADLGTWELDLATGTAIRSSRHDRFFGHAEPQEHWSQAIAERHILEEDRPAFRAAFERAAATGELAFELRVRWADGSIHWIAARGRRHEDDGGRPVSLIGVVGEITERKAAEARLAALVGFGDRLRESREPGEIVRAAVAAIAQGLGTVRAGYGILDPAEATITVECDWTDGRVPSVAGAWPLAGFWPGFADALQRGEVVAITDVAADPRTAGQAATGFAAGGIRALIDVPVIERGRAAAILFAHDMVPRRWSAEDVAFALGIAERARATAERVRVEAALREREARLRLATEGAGVGTWEIDFAADRGQWSPEAVALLGIERPSFTAADWAEAVHPEDRAAAAQAWRRAVEQDAVYEIEYRALSPAPDGGERWLLSRGKVEREAGTGRPRRGAGVLLDATARRRAQAALRESEARFRRVLQVGTVGVVFFDDDGRITDANDAFLQMLGYTRSALAAGLIRYDERTPADWRWKDRETWAELRAAGQTAPFEKEYLRRDGSRLWVLCAGMRLGEGAAVEFILDVTERKRAAERLREGEERLRLIVENVRDYAIFTSDHDDRIETWLPGAAQVFGWTAAEVVGRPAAITFVPEDVAAGEPQREVEAVRREGIAANTRWHLRKDGARVFIEGSTTALHGPDGAVRGFLRIGQDVTARRAAEERQALLTREVDHRAKNALTVVQTMLRLTRAETVPAFARAVEGRVAALARAQTLLAEERWDGADLRALLRGELAPFLAGQQAELAGPMVVLPPSAAQAIGMAIHELATNAAKYGALSAPGGRLLVHWRIDGPVPGVLRMRWTETGGPPVAGPPSRHGFGSRVLDGTVRSQLGGQVVLTWAAAGLDCQIEVPLARGADAVRAAE